MMITNVITKNPLQYLFYDDEGFVANMGSLKWINVVAWCYIDDVHKELENVRYNESIKSRLLERV